MNFRQYISVPVLLSYLLAFPLEKNFVLTAAPGGKFYRVKNGDSLLKIARRFGYGRRICVAGIVYQRTAASMRERLKISGKRRTKKTGVSHPGGAGRPEKTISIHNPLSRKDNCKKLLRGFRNRGENKISAGCSVPAIIVPSRLRTRAGDKNFLSARLWQLYFG